MVEMTVLAAVVLPTCGFALFVTPMLVCLCRSMGHCRGRMLPQDAQPLGAAEQVRDEARATVG